MSDIITKFKSAKRTISDLKDRKAKIEGKKEQILSELKEKYSIMTIEEADVKLEEMTAEQMELENKINDSLKKMNVIIEEADICG